MIPRKYWCRPEVYVNLVKQHLERSKKTNIRLEAENRYLRRRLERLKNEITKTLNGGYYNGKK